MAHVLSGLDRWIAGGPEVIGLSRGARIALLAHPASVDRRARHVVEWLQATDDHRLERLFAPEHGLWGHEQDMEPVASSVDPWTGLEVTSLYGDGPESLRPDERQFDGLDAVVVDLQDVGSRYYTFIYTLAYLMEVAGRAGVRVVVLDRPNPIGGEILEGPVLEPALSSFVGRYPIPIRHGMTIGELARMFRARFGAACELDVVPMEGWRREMTFEDTRLPWVPPSPNMPTPSTARVYPGGCLIEGTNLSEGRGTTLPFELVGAPWIDGRELAARCSADGLPGVLLRAASFRPMFQKHAGTGCGGLQVLVTDTREFRPVATYLAILRAARRLAPQEFVWRTDTYEFETARPAIDYLLGVDGLRELLENDTPLAELEAGWAAGLASFERSRGEFLLYGARK